MTGGDYVATLWAAQTVWGTVPICTVFRIVDGLIQEVRSFWDPRPVCRHSDDERCGAAVEVRDLLTFTAHLNIQDSRNDSDPKSIQDTTVGWC